MRTLIVSDIHGNLVALEAVLRSAESDSSFHALWCLGDTVGYGPQPVECIARLRELGAVSVAGNHDRAATGAMSTEYFNPDAAEAALWTRRRLGEQERTELDALPEVVKRDNFTLVHGSLRDPIWEYFYDEEVALGHLELQETPFSLVGHTHVPMVAYQHPDWTQQCELYQLTHGDAVRLPERGKMVLNPGSVGQPRDHDPRASYAVYDPEAAEVTLTRVEYDINATQSLMVEAGLPRWLIQRLSQGR